ncbi:MAG: MmcQ/YjbR family DNA-binding protein [Bacteroidetes bacterium]|nr:MmcQ/YjbR family DNA-binding protein [Bacteroidota bacterium]
MNIEEIRAYCLNFHDTTESFPFDEDVLVFKVSGKIFCLTSLSEPDRMNLKCDPEKAIELREQYPCVIPGYHMSKKMWNTVIIDGSVSKKMLQSWIKHSFDEVVKGLPKKLQLQHQTKK